MLIMILDTRSHQNRHSHVTGGTETIRDTNVTQISGDDRVESKRIRERVR